MKEKEGKSLDTFFIRINKKELKVEKKREAEFCSSSIQLPPTLHIQYR